MRRCALVGLMLASVGAASPATAQPQGADAITRHGLDLRREGRDAEALDEFRRAYALDAAPRTLAQIALAEQALGRWVDAEAHLVQALAASGDGWIGSHRGVLQSGLATIRQHLGSLDVDVDVTGAELWVNGAQVATAPLAAPMRVEAGSVVLEVRAPGYATARRMTNVDPGGSSREAVHLVPLAPSGSLPQAPSASVPPTGSAPPEVAPPITVVVVDRPLRTTAYVWLGAGVVGILAGTYFGVRTLTTKSDRDQECGGPNGSCSLRGVVLDAEARNFAVRSTASFAGGLVAAGVGAALFWVSRSHVPAGPTAALWLDLGTERATAGVRGSW
jgi:hypothetical protein